MPFSARIFAVIAVAVFSAVPSGGRIERVPNPKDIETYISKLQKTHADRLALFCNE